MWKIDNPGGSRRVLSTRELPGTAWRSILMGAGYRLEVWSGDAAAEPDLIAGALSPQCDAVIGQLTEKWDETRLKGLAMVGGQVYSNYAVGFDNVDVDAATRAGIVVTNTPGVLTQTTAELAVGLTVAAARRLIEADTLVRTGEFTGWEPDLLLGTRLHGNTLGVVGAGRIGSAYALMMVRGFGMNLVYHGPTRKPVLEAAVERFSSAERSDGRRASTCRFEPDLDRMLATVDVVSLHPSLNPDTFHLLDAGRLKRMKHDAILVNVSRGQVIDEEALVEHCAANPQFRAALDVFEDEPALKPGLADLPNVILAPHIGSATTWTRSSMSILAARNVVGVLERYPLWDEIEYQPLLLDGAPNAIPSIVNRDAADWV